jgi:hypothetical protein
MPEDSKKSLPNARKFDINPNDLFAHLQIVRARLE